MTVTAALGAWAGLGWICAIIFIILADRAPLEADTAEACTAVDPCFECRADTAWLDRHGFGLNVPAA